MAERIHREFTVNVPLDMAWQHFSRIEQWPSWAKHIRRVQLEPPGELTPASSGAFHRPPLRFGLPLFPAGRGGRRVRVNSQRKTQCRSHPTG
jgi:hypothetical protein